MFIDENVKRKPLKTSRCIPLTPTAGDRERRNKGRRDRVRNEEAGNLMRSRSKAVGGDVEKVTTSEGREAGVERVKRETSKSGQNGNNENPSVCLPA